MVDFGSQTTAATKLLQRWVKSNGVDVGDVSGIVGGKTFAAAIAGQSLGWTIGDANRQEFAARYETLKQLTLERPSETAASLKATENEERPGRADIRVRKEPEKYGR